MIQIHTEQIEKWEEIKEEHIKFVTKVIKEKLSKLPPKYLKNAEFIEKVFKCKYENKEFKIINTYNIETIAVGKLEEIKAIFDKYEIDEERSEILKYILDYKEIYKDGYRDILISKMDIEVCPYCNINLIVTYKDVENGRTKSTADIDHFYTKSKYPQYALSLYNFIPACQMCNSRLKATKSSEGSLYPYEEGYEKYASTFELIGTGNMIKNELKIIDDFDINDFNIHVKTNNKRVMKSIKIFKTNAIYSSNICKERIIRLKNNITEYPQELVEQINKISRKNKTRKEYVLRELDCKNENEMLKRPFSKLENDIYEKYCQGDGSLGNKK